MSEIDPELESSLTEGLHRLGLQLGPGQALILSSPKGGGGGENKIRAAVLLATIALVGLGLFAWKVSDGDNNTDVLVASPRSIVEDTLRGAAVVLPPETSHTTSTDAISASSLLGSITTLVEPATTPLETTQPEPAETPQTLPTTSISTLDSAQSETTPPPLVPTTSASTSDPAQSETTPPPSVPTSQSPVVDGDWRFDFTGDGAEDVLQVRDGVLFLAVAINGATQAILETSGEQTSIELGPDTTFACKADGSLFVAQRETVGATQAVRTRTLEVSGITARWHPQPSFFGPEMTIASPATGCGPPL